MRIERVLIALDHSVLSAHAAEVGIELANRLGAETALVHAVDPKLRRTADHGRVLAELIVGALIDGRSLLERIAKRAKLPSAPFEFVPVGHPATEIIRTAADWRAELLVIGSHRPREEGQRRQNSVSDEVMRYAPCPILMVTAALRTTHVYANVSNIR